MQPRSEKQLTSMAGVPHTPQTRPRGSDHGAAPQRLYQAHGAAPKTRAPPCPRAPRVQARQRRRESWARAGSRANRSSRHNFFPRLLPAAGAVRAEVAVPSRSQRPPPVPAAPPRPGPLPFPQARWARERSSRASRPARSQVSASGDGSASTRASVPRGPTWLGLQAFPPAARAGSGGSNSPAPARRLRARSLPQAGASRYASSQPPLSGPRAAPGRRRREE
ncbi:atherin-like [Pteropus vampyrus]|uniref:Atherin-like n=1 Tax=Pteropus vampyrus TaxID=132908 RepID=A0A6P6BTK2_PTEVA|nr:atherin-like [Pteropus vampyrus]